MTTLEEQIREEFMTKEDMIVDTEHLIMACGSAIELAELAKQVRYLGEYHAVAPWKDFYHSLCTEIAKKAGLPNEYWVGTDFDAPIDIAIARI